MSRAARSRVAFLTIICAVFVALDAPCFAQMNSPNDANVQRVTVTGTVVNSETNQPIARALVEMMQYAMLTDDRGQFRFDGVPTNTSQFQTIPGAMIRVSKPGYFSPDQLGNLMQPGASGPANMVTLTDPMPPVVIKLVPEGIIYGQVSSQNGEPLDSVGVQVTEGEIQNGVKVWTRRNGTATDDEGRFRLADLRPGTYYLSAGPSHAPASQPVAAGIRVQGYAMAFYPAAPDMASATPIVITPGKKVELDFTLSREPFYRLAGTVTGFGSLSNFTVLLSAPDGSTIMGVPVNPRTGQFQSDLIPPGSYTLRGSGQNPPKPGDPDANELYSARLALTVDRDITGLQLVLRPSHTIQVNCRVDSSSNPPDGNNMCPVTIQFLLSGSSDLAGMNRVPGEMRYTDSDGQVKIAVRGGDPGRYGVSFEPNANFYVASATFGNVDLLRDDFVVGEEPPAGTIDLVLRDAGGRLSAQVSAPPGSQDALVFLVSDDSPNLVKMTRSGPSGNAQFWGLAPGSYKVFALDNADGLEYRKRGALDQFLSSAASVTISENQQATVTVPLIHREN